MLTETFDKVIYIRSLKKTSQSFFEQWWGFQKQNQLCFIKLKRFRCCEMCNFSGSQIGRISNVKRSWQTKTSFLTRPQNFWPFSVKKRGYWFCSLNTSLHPVDLVQNFIILWKQRTPIFTFVFGTKEIFVKMWLTTLCDEVTMMDQFIKRKPPSILFVPLPLKQ
jgi:hypothetical protein